jgi:hypothetical protein
VIGNQLAALDRLEKCVVKFACDANALSQSLIESNADGYCNLLHPQVINGPNSETSTGNTEETKPVRLIESRWDNESERCSLVVPNPVVIRSYDDESISTGFQFCKVGFATTTCLLPIAFSSFEAIAKRTFSGTARL